MSCISCDAAVSVSQTRTLELWSPSSSSSSSCLSFISQTRSICLRSLIWLCLFSSQRRRLNTKESDYGENLWCWCQSMCGFFSVSRSRYELIRRGDGKDYTWVASFDTLSLHRDRRQGSNLKGLRDWASPSQPCFSCKWHLLCGFDIMATTIGWAGKRHITRFLTKGNTSRTRRTEKVFLPHSSRKKEPFAWNTRESWLMSKRLPLMRVMTDIREQGKLKGSSKEEYIAWKNRDGRDWG